MTQLPHIRMSRTIDLRTTAGSQSRSMLKRSIEKSTVIKLFPEPFEPTPCTGRLPTEDALQFRLIPICMVLVVRWIVVPDGPARCARRRATSCGPTRSSPSTTRRSTPSGEALVRLQALRAVPTARREPTTSPETTEVGFFGRHELPPLSTGRVTVAQVARMFEHHDRPDLPTDFD